MGPVRAVPWSMTEVRFAREKKPGGKVPVGKLLLPVMETVARETRLVSFAGSVAGTAAAVMALRVVS